VRKISGFNKPSNANERALMAAVDEIADLSTRLLSVFETNAPPKNREEEAARAKSSRRREIRRLSQLKRQCLPNASSGMTRGRE
jgi:hypothetical protein